MTSDLIRKVLLVYKWNLGECSRLDALATLRPFTINGVLRELSENIFELEGEIDLKTLREYAYRSVTLSSIVAVRYETDITDCLSNQGLKRRQRRVSFDFVFIGRGTNKDLVLECVLEKFIQQGVFSQEKIYPRRKTEFFLLVDASRGKAYWGEYLHRIRRDRFTYRSPEKRPYTQFSALSPRVAIFLVNLSTLTVEAGGRQRRFLDPFCGSGSTLIEAALLGYYAIGVEVHYKPIRGARRNAIFYNLYENIDLILSDATWLPLRGGSIDAVAFDPPYGRLAPTKGRDPGEILRSALNGIREVVRQGGSYVFLYPGKTIDDELRSSGYVEMCRIFEHSSLTRSVWCFHNDNKDNVLGCK
ncbi:RsmD family RNA methyltransferase [Infirmifilum lucidum]|uniref:RsmD family RNA methyltransferase n=1 Tax=Infirmifilum lucidum TaxID=2776706 RepID=A0A7L9FJ02_9CREN|nr:RsmD family RNA methyltransferase [Infirmifilum lucidum]QOJ79621.1 RsmD family RNA methyltransferase [Infirmifilum lucidum]